MNAPRTLRVVTWNVGEVYWPWQGNQLKDQDVALVRSVIAELDPDVVLLQELLHRGQLDLLVGDGYVGQMAAACGYDRHVGLLVRAQHQPRFVDHLLVPTQRGAVEAQFMLGPKRVRALSLHLDVFARPRRLLQVRAAAAIIAADPSALMVAGGDFNYDPVASARLGHEDDALAEAAMNDVLRDVAADCGPTLIGLLRVDRVFAGGALLAGSHAFTAPQRTPLGDHAPLVCDLRLRDLRGIVPAVDP